MKQMPEFFIVGAAKSGTTALYSWLSRHPSIFFPTVKEPNYFALSGKASFYRGDEMDINYCDQFALNLKDYEGLYESAGSGQLCGDASPSYLYYTESAHRIFAANPNARIIAVFRAPADRMESQFRHNRRDGYEPCRSLEDALAQEEERIAQGWWWGFHYRAASQYADQWRAYCSIFPSEQLLPLRYSDLSIDPEGIWRQVLNFLDLDYVAPPNFKPRVNDTSRLGSVPASGALERFIRHPSALKSVLKAALPKTLRRDLLSSVRSLNRAQISPVTSALKLQLNDEFQADTMALANLTDLDLSDW